MPKYDEEEEVLDDIENDEDEIDRGDDFESDELENEDGDEEDLEDEEEDEDSEEDLEDEEEDEDSEEDLKGIPRSRLNEVIAQRNQERDRSAWLEEQLELLIKKETVVEPKQEKEKAPEYDYESNEAKYIDLIIEGETAAASKLRQEIDVARRSDMEFRMKAARDEAAEDAFKRSELSRDEEKFMSELVSAKEKYPFLDDEDDNYNQEAVETINAAMNGFKADGKSNSVALKMAVNKFAKFYVEKAPKLAGKRTKASRKKAAKASNQQPPKTPKGKKGVSKDLDSIDINKLSEKDFNSLTAREKKILRGD